MKPFDLIKKYYFRSWRRVLIGLIALVAVDAFQIFIPWFIKEAVDILTEDPTRQKEIITIGVYILGLALGIGGARFVWRYCIIGLSRKIEENLRNRFYRHLQSLSYSYFDHTSVGDLMAHGTNDLEAVRMMCGIGLVAGLDAIFLLAASLTMMFSLNSTLTFYVLIPMPIVTFAFLKLGPKLHKRFRGVQAGFSRISEKAQETFAGIKVIKSFVQEDAESENFRELNRDYIDINMKLVRVWGLLHPLIWTIAGSCSVIILFFGGNRVIDMQLSMGDFVAFNSYLGILIWPMIAVGWVTNLYQRGKASLNRLVEIFEVKPGIQNLPGAMAKRVEGEIEFKDLTFSYNGEQPVLKNINLKIPAKSSLAIMGPTGSSKTALVNLIPRLYDPPPGTVLIDGIDNRKYMLNSLRAQIGFVHQQTFLFSDTILENIRFGLKVSEKKVQDAADAAQLNKEVDQFPRGFETMVGEKGVTLSGGQKQRVSIARALIQDTPVYVFDDAFSAVDSETEDFIMKSLKKQLSDKTVILISHRISIAQRADNIIFMENGEIAEQGTHEELLKKRGRYFEIYEHQKLLEEIEKHE